MLCSTCNEPIGYREKTAHGPDGESHERCAKIGKARGVKIDVFSLDEEISKLKKRVQELERTVEHHAANIPFRIGGGG